MQIAQRHDLELDNAAPILAASYLHSYEWTRAGCHRLVGKESDDLDGLWQGWHWLLVLMITVCKLLF